MSLSQEELSSDTEGSEVGREVCVEWEACAHFIEDAEATVGVGFTVRAQVRT